MNRLAAASISSLLLAAACADPDAADADFTGRGKADQISGQDDPSGLLADAERRLTKLIKPSDIGDTFGVASTKVPYPDTYWPMTDNGIAVEWLEKSGERCDSANECSDPQPSPLAKLVGMVAPIDVEAAVEWEIENHGKEREGVSAWWGHCPGWVASAMLNPPVKQAVHVAFDEGQLWECEPGEVGCTTFEIGDVNAVSAEAHEGAESRFIGARCDTKPTEIERDEYGRIVRTGAGCQGLNAGAMLIVMGNRMKGDKLPFAINAQSPWNTDEIWNQPAYRYTVNRFEALTPSEAANLVATGGASRTGNLDAYLWNDAATGFAFVDVTLDWVTEQGPNLERVSGLDSTNQTRMVAVIELDGEPTSTSSEIIGGEYLDDDSVGASRLTVAPFVWIADDVGPDDAHNPYVDGELVKQLLALTR
jgi:hypothetical protein